MVDRFQAINIPPIGLFMAKHQIFGTVGIFSHYACRVFPAYIHTKLN